MAFKDSLRLEQIYFQKLKDMIKTFKAWYDGENTDKDRDILEGLIQACAAILLLYRNLGEEWNELTALIQKNMHDLIDLKDKIDDYHDELNQKIDDVNNYLNSAITTIEAQIDAFGGLPSNANANEGDVLTVGENHVNEWRTLKTDLQHYYLGFSYDINSHEYSELNNHLLYKAIGEEIEDAGKTLIVAKIVESDEIPALILSNYLRGTCLLSAYVVDSGSGAKRFAEIIDCAFDLNTGVANITFNLTSDKHYVANEIGNHYYPALFLRYNLLAVPSSPNIEWTKYKGEATPVISNLLH